MKKLVLAALAVVVLAGSALADFNLRLGVDFAGAVDAVKNKKMDTGFTVGVEQTFGLIPKLEVGLGAEILIPRKYADAKGASTYLPLYLTVKANPILTAPGVFFKGNVGYNVLALQADISSDFGGSAGLSGGMYYALAAGYELPLGLFFDLTYAIYNSELTSVNVNNIIGNKGSSYSTLRLNAGIKL
ncbi:outer membrane beta-barrel protein [Endomicrobium proavitum]|uniref:Outer membrane protein beta-barrel domain-containing protein n=1 Tax=Endomicrobium proavitum TaxID=1408281 RepID=A0A0G3WJQ1_9BACT|nr:outer membrane beta-barrel protein [Endomicrobium proavitum]AKL98513.1 exported protein of unknown function [Endomicrobium proavitum]